MRKLRVAAAALAVLTALVDWLIALDHSVHAGAIASTAIAAACLAACTPFEVTDTSARKLVALACAAYLLAIGGALALAVYTESQKAPVAVLAGLTASGVVMTVWSLMIRNRRRRSAWRNYYDM